MSKQRGIGHDRIWLAILLGLGNALLVTLAQPQAALAHPPDVYLQASYITVAPAQIDVELDLTPGVLVVPQLLPVLDPDGNQEISAAEGRAYIDAVLRNVTLRVDDTALVLKVARVELPPYLSVRAGYGTIRVFAAAPLTAVAPGAHRIEYKNNHAPSGSMYQVNAIVGKSAAITLGKLARDVKQQGMALDFAAGGAAPTEHVPAVAASALPADATGRARQLLAYLSGPVLSPWALMLALGLALALGGLHALTPGHGKTLVAAYLVGSRGTLRHAALLGAVTTLTHTTSVMLIGLLALFASKYVVPTVLVPALEILSGLLVILLGARLVWQRWTSWRGGKPADHAHGAIDPRWHAHGGRAHTHAPPADGLKPHNLLAMGVSGGLVPCPEALGIMVVAIGLNRIALGLGLIVAFSLGLAAVLIGIGMLLVRSRALLTRFGGLSGRWSQCLPLVSAAIVLLLGLGITMRGLAGFQG